MKTNNENEKPGEAREARTTAPGAETADPEPGPSPDAPDFRETTEGGYGWGV